MAKRNSKSFESQKSFCNSKHVQVCSRLALSVFLWVALLSQISICPTPRPPVDESVSKIVCLDQNPIIRMLSQKRVEVYQNPRDLRSSPRRTCDLEWSLHKTCCDGGSLQQYAAGDIEKLRQAISRVDDDMRKLLAGLKDHNEKIQAAQKQAQSEETNKDNARQRESTREVPVAIDNGPDAEEIRKDVAMFSELIERNLADKRTIEESRTPCFEQIKAIRTSSLCASCSGNSARFFLQGRALISMPDCRVTLQKCGDVWTKSIEVINAISVAKRVALYLKVVSNHVNLPEFSGDGMKLIHKFMGGRSLMSHLKSCNESPILCSDQSAKFLCETFISIGEAEFLESTDAALANSNASGHQSGVVQQDDPTQSGSNWRLQRLLMALSASGSPTGSILVTKVYPEGLEAMPVSSAFP